MGCCLKAVYINLSIIFVAILISMIFVGEGLFKLYPVKLG